MYHIQNSTEPVSTTQGWQQPEGRAGGDRGLQLHELLSREYVLAVERSVGSVKHGCRINKHTGRLLLAWPKRIGRQSCGDAAIQPQGVTVTEL